jgi:DNA helicase-4
MDHLTLGWLNVIIAGFQSMASTNEGILLGKSLLAYPNYSETIAYEEGFFFGYLIWGQRRIRIIKHSSILDFVQHQQHRHRTHWQGKYSPVYKRLCHSSDIFMQILSGRDSYLRKGQVHTMYQAQRESLCDIAQYPALDILGFDLTHIHSDFHALLIDPVSFQTRWNDAWATKQKEHYRPLFETLENHPLTLPQRDACIIDEENVLVIAGAGTGKTSTMRAKAAYLVQSGLAKPEELLLLAFASKARDELAERVHGTPGLEKVHIETFHSLGKSILETVLGKKIDVSVMASDNKQFEKEIDNLIEALFGNAVIEKLLRNYFGQYLFPVINVFDFASEGKYFEYLKETEVRDLDGNLVRSHEELRISNYLYQSGITFEYEPNYPYEESTPDHRPYKPDYFLPDLNVYIEHFGVDENGNTRADINKNKYNAEMVWKRKIHATHNTTLIETYSYESKQGLATVLEQKLRAHCVQHEIDFNKLVKPRDNQAMLADLLKLGQLSMFSKLMADFLNAYKASLFDIHSLKNMPIITPNDARFIVFGTLFEAVYQGYQSKLEDAQQVDFNDMIRLPVEILLRPSFHADTDNKYRFKYIMVDEFQDISPIRAKLVSALRSVNPGCAMFCVGDDWQAIYRFTGSDVALTTNYEDHFGPTRTVLLDKTFRFNNRISEVASKFVMQNPTQITKQLVTHSTSTRTEVHIVKQEKPIMLQACIDQILQERIPSNKKTSLLVLARFNKSLKEIEGELAIYSKTYPYLDIKTLSAHGSKGREADYVIILDVIEGKHGFPSTLETDPILLKILPKLDNFKHSEERRLFYVAMTRARKTLFIHTQAGMESAFIKELQDNEYDVTFDRQEIASEIKEPFVCPQCLVGKLRLKKNKYETVFTCSLGSPYCDSTLIMCSRCNSAPLFREDKYHVCANEACDYRVLACPKCSVGNLQIRERKSDKKQFFACSNFRGKGVSKGCSYTCNV